MLADDLARALDPLRFAHALGFEPDAWQGQVLRSQSRRLLLNCARQTGKSTTTALLALHRAVYYAGSLILLVSPSLRQSSELFRKVTDHLARLDATPRLTEDNRLSLTLANGSRVVSLPSSEATVRGFSGAALIIEDEAARVPDDLYRAVRPMLAVSGGRLVLMSTPYGTRGHFYEAWANGGDSWQRVTVTAAECARIPAGFLDEERRSMGEWWFRQEYECVFLDAQTAAFRREDVDGMFTAEVETWAL